MVKVDGNGCGEEGMGGEGLNGEIWGMKVRGVLRRLRRRGEEVD